MHKLKHFKILQVNSYPGQVIPVHKSTRTKSSRTSVKSYPCLGQLVPILTATHTAFDLLVTSIVYLPIYCLYCLTATSAFSKRKFGICCHLLRIQTDVTVKLFKSLVRPYVE